MKNIKNEYSKKIVKCFLKTPALGEKSGIRRLRQCLYIVYRYVYACSFKKLEYLMAVLSRSTYLQLISRGMLDVMLIFQRKGGSVMFQIFIACPE